MDGRTRGSLPFVGMIAVVLAQASNMVVMKMAMSDGINKYTMVFYSNALSSRPPSYFLHHLLQVRVVSSSHILCPPQDLLARSNWICGYVSIDYSSPVLGMAMMNHIPAFTFILAIISRMEEVNWKSSSSQAKLVGTIASILGAFVVTLYKGPPILPSRTPPSSVQPRRLLFLLLRQSNWILGRFLLAAKAFSISLWYIGQAFVLKDCPAVLNLMFYSNFFTTILSGRFSFVIVREPQSWILKVDAVLIAILYSALVAGVFRVTLCTWCLKETGPVYASMFKPLGIVFAVGLGFIFLGEMLHLGRYKYSPFFSIELPIPHLTL